MVPRLDRSNNPRSGVFWMVRTPDIRNCSYFNHLPGGHAIDEEVYDRTNSAYEFGSWAMKKRPDSIQTKELAIAGMALHFYQQPSSV
jgi:hypothetical protein